MDALVIYTGAVEVVGVSYLLNGAKPTPPPANSSITGERTSPQEPVLVAAGRLQPVTYLIFNSTSDSA